MIGMRSVLKGLIAAACAALAACQTLSVEDKEDLLAEAGFTRKLADTPEKIGKMRTLAPNKFTQVVQDGRIVYVYADPNICNCIYLGYEQNFERYRQLVRARANGDEERLIDIVERDSRIDFAMWGWGRGY